MRMFNKELYLY